MTAAPAFLLLFCFCVSCFDCYNCNLMPQAPTRNAGKTIFYEQFGSDGDEPILLTMGLGTQCLAWNEDFISLLVAKKYRVIRFDNRDVGLSSKYDELGSPNLVWKIVRKKFLEFFIGPPKGVYSIGDMADDAFDLMDHLKIESAHIVGASMGGMIVQHMAIDRPTRVKSMCSIMSTTGEGGLPQADMDVQRAILRKPKTEEHEKIRDHAILVNTLIAEPASPPDDLEKYLDIVINRCYHPVGAARQISAILGTGDRSHALGGLTCNCMVVHGAGDRLVKIEHAHATARAIDRGRPGYCRKVIIEKMGHSLPREFYGQIADAIVSNARGDAKVEDIGLTIVTD